MSRLDTYAFANTTAGVPAEALAKAGGADGLPIEATGPVVTRVSIEEVILYPQMYPQF
jgi:hypothetical protein